VIFNEGKLLLSASGNGGQLATLKSLA